MKKTILILMIGMFLIGGVIAGSIILTDTKFTPTQPQEQERFTGEITFKCGTENMKLYLNMRNSHQLNDLYGRGMSNKHKTPKQITMLEERTLPKTFLERD